MKKLVIALAVIIVLSAVASADVLLTANSLGAGKLGWLAAGQYNSNMGSNITQMGGGLALGYGVMDKLDVYGNVGYATQAGLPPVLSSSSGLMFRLMGKYQVLAEGKDMPVSVAGLAEYQTATVSYNTVFATSGQTVQGDIGIGAIVSKIMIPWVPYGALVYHSLTSNPGAVTGSDLEIALGSQMLLSRSSAVLGEVSLNSNSSGGATFTNTQISLAYMAKI